MAESNGNGTALRPMERRVRPHRCAEDKTCTCRITALEPAENCPRHGVGEWPPRCGTCGRFLPHQHRAA